jgi:hypothetical protein
VAGVVLAATLTASAAATVTPADVRRRRSVSGMVWVAGAGGAVRMGGTFRHRGRAANAIIR